MQTQCIGVIHDPLTRDRIAHSADGRVEAVCTREAIFIAGPEDDRLVESRPGCVAAALAVSDDGRYVAIITGEMFCWLEIRVESENGSGWSRVCLRKVPPDVIVLRWKEKEGRYLYAPEELELSFKHHGHHRCVPERKGWRLL